ncbi:MAG TPA: family 49 glycosyl hydrolase [Kiritimatiellia bacterium]|nr:family 49 glycosyl hydrolase [Kiritimatiellia bacterium]
MPDPLAPDDIPLHTWDHPDESMTTEGPVPESAVRRSTRYAVNVSLASRPDQMQASFVYMSVPRSGRRERPYPRVDGAEFAAAAGLTMSWSSFLYREDVVIDIVRTDGRTFSSVEEVTIRPTTLSFRTERIAPDTLRIHVPFHPDGYRFSVEFADDLFTAYNDLQGITGNLTEQPVGPAIHTEPRHALLVFADPFPDPALVPTPADGDIHYPAPGFATGLSDIDTEILYFPPGVYWIPWNEHAYLLDRVRWIYLAPGAYVKGAMEFRGTREDYRVTGHGVLSGELYVYEADRSRAHGHVPYTQRSDLAPDCHGTCVKMLQFFSMDHPQNILVHGITLLEPPYHTFTIHGNLSSIRADFHHYKQVGGWYWQTDGVELYPRSTLQNSFLHSNDDVIKLYHSHASVRNVVVWKGENGPVFQWGWVPRNVRDVHVDRVDIIHNRMYWKDVKSNTGIFNSSAHWDYGSPRHGDASAIIENLLLENIRSEGMNHVAMRFLVLSAWRNIEIRNLWIEQWNEMPPHSQQSLFYSAWSPRHDRPVPVGNETSDRQGLRLINYRVGEEIIAKASDNWPSDRAGRLNFAPEHWEAWDARP